MKKNSIHKGWLTVLVILLIVGGGLLAYKYRKHQVVTPDPENAYVPSPTPNTAVKDAIKPERVLLNVPFTSQAPNGNWADPKQEDGCEEASVLMAWGWINATSFTKNEAEKAIIAMSDFETAHYGNYHDFNAADTAQFMKDYYNYDKVSVVMNPSIDDMKKQLRQGTLVLVPTNGQLLGNPNYKQPGPTTHMLVVKGFDDTKGVFITNDPGTRNGEGYTYKFQTLYNAMVDYPSGNHGSQAGRPKSMILVNKP